MLVLRAGGPAVPVIRTARLTLRGHRVDDLAAALTMWSDPIVTRFTGGKPSSEQQTWSRLLNYTGHWALLGYGYWAIEHNATGTFVGELGFAQFRRAIAPAMRDAPELGWALVAAMHGQGLASEAVGAAVRWGDAAFAGARTVALVDPANLASVRVAEKNGYTVFARGDYGDRPALFLERPGGRPTTLR